MKALSPTDVQLLRSISPRLVHPQKAPLPMELHCDRSISTRLLQVLNKPPGMSKFLGSVADCSAEQ